VTGNVYPFKKPPPRPEDWRQRLCYKQARRGEEELIACKANAVTILRNDPDWIGTLAFNELSQGIVCRSPAPWHIDDAPADVSAVWTETDGDRVQNWLQRVWSLTVSEGTAYRAALMVAEAQRFNPLREWLDGLEHDGLPRVERMLSVYFGCEDTPYTRLVSRLFTVGSVARAYEPGCKFDTMLVLEGKQDLGKSTGARALYGAEYFRETPIDLHSNDRFLAMQGCWCREWPELDGHGKADERRVKSFLSAQVDDFRAPYGRTMVHVPRVPVLIATVNPPQLGYLVDETGNRRMLPVVCGATGPIDVAGLEADRPQLWAEARDMYRAGAHRYAATAAEKALCNGEQLRRMLAEVWEGKSATWLAEPLRAKEGTEITIRQILAECLNIPTERWDQGNATRAGKCLARAGWVCAGQRGSGDRERFYVRRPEAAPHSGDVERDAIASEPATEPEAAE
jgi:putative DNA primase/helicase